MEIGTAIKTLRKSKGMTQKELATKCELSANALCTLERNGSFPTKDTIEKICAALSIPVSYLLFFSITEDDVPEQKRVVFKAIEGLMKDALLP